MVVMNMKKGSPPQENEGIVRSVIESYISEMEKFDLDEEADTGAVLELLYSYFDHVEINDENTEFFKSIIEKYY